MESSSTASPPSRRRRLTIGSIVVLIAVIACGLSAYREHVRNTRVWAKAYYVGDLITGSGMSRGAGSGFNFAPMVDLIHANVSPSSWKGQGGSGTITPFFLNGSLIVRNNERVHREVDAYILRMRKARRQSHASQAAP